MLASHLLSPLKFDRLPRTFFLFVLVAVNLGLPALSVAADAPHEMVAAEGDLAAEAGLKV
ncbi:MAG: hypothetical protein JO166_16340, partial [Deltaproteobacteria bacterium]|nr:hypothetical protein [Deltaproteobacteria bacterium]